MGRSVGSQQGKLLILLAEPRLGGSGPECRLSQTIGTVGIVRFGLGAKIREVLKNAEELAGLGGIEGIGVRCLETV
jgi:hypothetical protein